MLLLFFGKLQIINLLIASEVILMGRVAKKLGYGKNTTPVSNVEFLCRKLDLHRWREL
jgi:putative ribosome biogenesis GTPase RsgA